MRNQSVTPDHVDERGTIADLLCEPFDSATVVTTRVGAVRGNHYHKFTHQWGYVVSGTLRVVTREMLECADGSLVEVGRKESIVRAGELMYSPPLEEHAWRALADTTVLVLTRGPRSGPGYELDTHRLAERDWLIR